MRAKHNQPHWKIRGKTASERKEGRKKNASLGRWKKLPSPYLCFLRSSLASLRWKAGIST